MPADMPADGGSPDAPAQQVVDSEQQDGGQPEPGRQIADAELALLSRYTGQTDLAALRQHMLAVWRRAISGPAPVYMCIRGLMFLEPRVKSHPAYPAALERMQAVRAAASGGGGPAPLWLDVGANVGTDVRQLRVDGLGEGELAALDIESARHYWHIGLDLYQDAARPPCRAFFGDITDDSVLPPLSAANKGGGGGGAAAAAAAAAAEGGAAPSGSGAEPAEAGPGNGQNGSIRELAGVVTVASCSAVLHCLGRETVQRLLGKTALLLQPGGLLLGTTLGSATPRPWEAAYQAGHTRWLHSPQSLAEALEAAGFVEVKVQSTPWTELDRAMGSMQPLLDAHVGPQPGLQDRQMLAFSAAKPGPGAEAA